MASWPRPVNWGRCPVNPAKDRRWWLFWFGTIDGKHQTDTVHFQLAFFGKYDVWFWCKHCGERFQTFNITRTEMINTGIPLEAFED